MTSHNLPAQATPFIGRTTELAEIAHLLADPASRLLTLVGPGGIGKTRLALEVANLLSCQPNVPFPDGIFFVPLQGLTSPGFIGSALAEAIHFQFYEGEDPQQQLIYYLRPKTLLLILDNFEHLLDGAGIVSDLLMSAPSLKILVTSRATLNLQEEWLYPVEGMPFPDKDDEEDLASYGAVQLFTQCARRVRPDFSLQTEHGVVLHICQRVEGMPLALEMTAAWLRRMPGEAIVQQLEHGLDILESPIRNVPERHRSMRAVFDHSWQLLTEPERDVLQKLSVFRGGFRSEAAEAVAGTSITVLAKLVDESLLRVNHSGRYDLHELLRQYAAERLAESPEAQADTLDRHSTYYAALVETLGARLHNAQQLEAHREFEQDLQNIYLAWDTATAQQHTSRLKQMTFELAYFLDMRNLSRDFEALAQQVAERISDGEPSLALGLSLMFQSICWRLSKDRPAQRALFDRSIRILRQFGAEREVALLLYYLPSLVHDYTERARLRQEGLALARSIADIWLEATFLLDLQRVEEWTRIPGNDDTALQNIATLARRLGDRWLLGRTYLSLCDAAYWRGELEMQWQYARASLELLREFGNPLQIISSLKLLAFAELNRGNLTESLRMYDEALRLAREQGNRWIMAQVLDSIGASHQMQHHDVEARHIYSEAVALYRELDEVWHLANELNNLGHVLADLGQYAEAESRFREAIQLALDQQFVGVTLESMAGLANLMGQAGQPERAVEVLTFAISLSHTIPDIVVQYGRYLDGLNVNLSPEAFAAAQERGKALQLDTALHIIADHFSIPLDAVPGQTSTTPPATNPDQLTPRELEVLCLVATGMTNRQIADQLVISPSTVNVHLNVIYGKLGVNSRTAATRYALDHNLC